MPHPFVPQSRIGEIHDWLPSHYSPINPATGKGNQGAYLAEIPEALFLYIVNQSNAADWAARVSNEEDADLDAAWTRRRRTLGRSPLGL